MSPLTQSIRELLPRLIPPGRSVFWVYNGKISIHDLGRGVAASFPTGAQIVDLRSDDLQTRDIHPRSSPQRRYSGPFVLRRVTDSGKVGSILATIRGTSPRIPCSGN
jgi:hypothetical protein